MTTTTNRPTFIIMAVSGKGKNTRFLEIGALWQNKGETKGYNGGINRLPIDLADLDNLVLVEPYSTSDDESNTTH